MNNPFQNLAVVICEYLYSVREEFDVLVVPLLFKECTVFVKDFFERKEDFWLPHKYFNIAALGNSEPFPGAPRVTELYNECVSAGGRPTDRHVAARRYKDNLVGAIVFEYPPRSNTE